MIFLGENNNFFKKYGSVKSAKTSYGKFRLNLICTSELWSSHLSNILCCQNNVSLQSVSGNKIHAHFCSFFFFWEKFWNFSFEVIQLLIVFLYADWVTLCSQDRGESLGWGCEIRALVKGTVQWKSSDNCC